MDGTMEVTLDKDLGLHPLGYKKGRRKKMQSILQNYVTVACLQKKKKSIDWVILGNLFPDLVDLEGLTNPE